MIDDSQCVRRHTTESYLQVLLNRNSIGVRATRNGTTTLHILLPIKPVCAPVCVCVFVYSYRVDLGARHSRYEIGGISRAHFKWFPTFIKVSPQPALFALPVS